MEGCYTDYNAFLMQRKVGWVMEMYGCFLGVMDGGWSHS